MNIQCKLVILIFVLTLDNQVNAGKIVGGHEVVPHSRPYMALLERRWPNGSIKFCGGFLLNEDFVMTAAHCDATSYIVKLGVHNIKKMVDVQQISVEKQFPSNDYNNNLYTSDIMLLKLSSKARFTETVKPITLAGKGDAALPKSCSVSGWGITFVNNEYMSDVLLEVNVTLIDNENCTKENLYCAEGKAGFGNGDSGGPLVCEDGKAYGVVSFVQPSSPPIYGFAKIPDYKRWIVSAMKNIGKL